MANLTRGGRSGGGKGLSSKGSKDLASLPLQTKLRMGRPGDALEQEADRVADRVVDAPSPDVSRMSGAEEKEPVQTRAEEEEPVQAQAEEEEPVQAQAEEEKPVQAQAEEEKPVQAQAEDEEPVQARAEEEEPVQARAEEEEPVQAQAEDEEPVQARAEEEEPVQAQAEEDEPVQARAEEEEPLQALAQEEEPVQPQAEEDEPVQAQAEEEEPVRARSEDEPAGLVVPSGAEVQDPDIERRLAAGKQGGVPLAAEVKQQMETRFNRDFSSVRIHTDADAVDLAQRLRALAFTHSGHIYFNQGRYDPVSTAGKRLLAHELAHVVQQGGALRRQPMARGRDVQRQPADATAGTEPESFEVSRGSYRGTRIEPQANPPKLLIPKVSIPTVKWRHQRRYGQASMYERQKLEVRRESRAAAGTSQRDRWNGHADIASSAEAARDEMARQAEDRGGVNTRGTYFFRARRNRNFIVFADRGRLLELFKVPNWDRQGEFRRFHVDHIVEHQVGGKDDFANYELLDGPTNSSSGSRLNNQINSRIRGALEALRNEHPSASGIPRASQFAGVRRTHEVRFNDFDFRLTTPGGRRRGLYWTGDEIKAGRHARVLKSLNQQEMKSLGDASTVSFFTTREGGTRLPKPASRKPNWIPAVEFVDWVPVPNDVAAGERSGTLQVLFFNRADRRYPLRAGQDTHQIAVRKIEGFAGGYIDRAELTRGMRRILRFQGLSPIEIDEAHIDGERGLFARGRILPTVPFIENTEIEILISGEGIELRKTFTLEEFQTPPPFQLNDTSLTVFYGTGRGLGVEGQTSFEIQGLGEGRIGASAARSSGFELEGEFEFDPNLFDKASVGVTYRGGQWGVSGQIQIPPGKVAGIRSATIDVSYADRTLLATGEAELAVPGVERGTMSVTVAPQGWSIDGTFSLSGDIPGIKSGSVSATVAKIEGEAGYGVTASGMAVPDIPGIDAQLSVEYDNGALMIDALANYERGLLSGEIRIGATNRAVDDAGNPTGEPQDTFVVFGSGELTIQITPWLEGTVGVDFLPDGQMIVAGRIGLPSSIEVFSRIGVPERELFGIGFDIPIFAIPVGPKSIGLKASIRGGLRAYAGIGPGRLEQLELGVIYNPDRPQDTQVSGAGRFVVPADAGLKLAVRATVGLDALIGGVEGGLEVAGGLGLEAAAEAGVRVDWTPSSGFELRADLSARVQPKFLFTVDGVIEAWVAWYDKEWRWRLVDFEYGSNMRFGVTLPIEYTEGRPFDVSFDDIEFERPEIDARSFLGGLIRDIRNRRA